MAYRKIQQENHSQRLMGETYMPSRSRVFNLIANLQGNKDQTRPIDQSEMRRLTDISERTIIRSLNELVADGAAIVHMNYGWVNDLYVRLANSYSIVKLSLIHLKEALERKKERDALRAKKLAESNRRRRNDLSDKLGTSITDPEYNKPRTAQECCAITQQLTMSLRSKGWI